MNEPRIVCLGGGTGTFVVLKGLKEYPVKLRAIVTMSDSGGSNKRIRDEFGLLPTSDIRQCFVALSEEHGGAGLLRQLFMYRFAKGEGLSGMTFGNLFMAALTDILGSQKEAIKQTGKVLRIHGKVIPVTLQKTDLLAEYENGQILTEEHLIDEPPHDGKLKITKLYLKPMVEANPDALEAIKKADLVILGPGDLYTSLLPNLLVKNITRSLEKTRAKLVFVLNLMTKYGQTYNFTARDHVRVLAEYCSRPMDYLIMNEAKLPTKALNLYQQYGEFPVVDDLTKNEAPRIIREDLISRKLMVKAKSDPLTRSLIRHHSQKLAKVIFSLLKKP